MRNSLATFAGLFIVGCGLAPGAATEPPGGDADILGTDAGIPNDDALATEPDGALGLDSAGFDADAEPTPPPVKLVLSVHDVFGQGGLVATVKGALPGAPVVLYGSTEAEAAPSCPAVLAPECLAFGGEAVLGQGAADGQGVAIIEHAALAAEPGTMLRLQAGSWAASADLSPPW